MLKYLDMNFQAPVIRVLAEGKQISFLDMALIRSSWRMTGFKKFAHFEEASDPQVNSQDIENELKRKARTGLLNHRSLKIHI